MGRANHKPTAAADTPRRGGMAGFGQVFGSNRGRRDAESAELVALERALDQLEVAPLTDSGRILEDGLIRAWELVAVLSEHDVSTSAGTHAIERLTDTMCRDGRNEMTAHLLQSGQLSEKARAVIDRQLATALSTSARGFLTTILWFLKKPYDEQAPETAHAIARRLAQTDIGNSKPDQQDALQTLIDRAAAEPHLHPHTIEGLCGGPEPGNGGEAHRDPRSRAPRT